MRIPRIHSPGRYGTVGVALGILSLASCGGTETGPTIPDPPEPPEAWGTLVASVAVTGPASPADFTLFIDGESHDFPPAGELTVDSLVGGTYDVSIDGPTRCTASGPSDVVVEGGAVARVSFDIACEYSDLSGRLLFSGHLERHVPMGYGLYTALPDGSDVRPFGYRHDVEANQTYPTISTDGAVVAFEQNDTLYVGNGDGTGFRALPSPAGGVGGFPAISPDGASVAFMRDGDIFMAGIDGSDVANLTGSEFDELNPAWHPESTHIAFVRDSAINNRLYVMNSDGSGVTALRTDARNYWEPAWSPDGTKLAVMSNFAGSGPELWIIDADGSNPRTVASLPAAASSPAWSPDGGRLSYQVLWPGTAGQRIYVLDTLGLVMDSIPPDGAPHVFHATWGPESSGAD